MVQTNRVLFWIIIGLILAGCAVNDEPSIDLPPLTLPPPLDSTFSGSCTDARLLETWLQTTSFQYDEFLELTNSAPNKTPDDLYADVERISALRSTVSLQAAPDCAAAAHIRLLGAMDALIPELQRYVNGEAVDLTAAVEGIQPALTTFDEELIVLLDRLELEFRQ